MRTLAPLLFAFAVGCAAGASEPEVGFANVRGERGYCPLCKMWHPRSELRWPVEIDGRRYAFCDPNCRAAFAKAPQRYLADAEFRAAAFGYVTAVWAVEGFECAGCARAAEATLRHHKGVLSVRATYVGGRPSGRIEILFDPSVVDEQHLIQELSQESDGKYVADRRETF
jgi:YHS domain-containing protein/copper chaperone CopZ